MNFLTQYGISPELANGVFIACFFILCLVVFALVAAFTKTEWYRKLDVKYGLVFKFVTDAVFMAEAANPEIRAMYEAKSREFNLPWKTLYVFDMVERMCKQAGFTIDIETQVYPMIMRILMSDASLPSMTPGANVEPVKVFSGQAVTDIKELSAAELRTMAAHKERLEREKQITR